MKQHFTFLVFLAALISGIGGFLFGYNTAVISGAILFIRKEFVLTSFDDELVVSSLLFGTIIGALFVGKASDLFGRHKTIYIVLLLFFVGILISSFAPNKEILIFGRAFLGIGVGSASIAVPLYISEISPSRIRGVLIAINQVMVTLGILVAYLINLAFAGKEAWREMFSIALIPSIFMAVGMVFLPESPRWLFKKGFKEKANDICKKLYGKESALEMEDLKKSLRRKEEEHIPLFQKSHLTPLGIGIGCAILSQISGINVIIYYASTIFKMTGLASDVTAILATVGIGLVNFLMTLVSLKFIDKAGRRALLLIGLLGMVVSLAVLGFAFTFPQSHLIWVAVGSLVFFVASFALGFGTVFWVLVAEIYAFPIRGRAMSLAILANWAANLAVVLTFLTLTRHLGQGGTFWLYGVVTLFTFFFVYFLVPETKGKSLEEIEDFWKK